MRTMRKIILTIILLAVSGLFRTAVSQDQTSMNERILTLMESIFSQIPADLAEIDPSLNRIAIYRIHTQDAAIPPPLKDHFEARLVQIFLSLGTPALVSLPEMNTLKISSTDTSFSIINSLPSPDELWRVGRRLRVDAFLEGTLTYVHKKALFLDLRLNRTGTNEVLWAKSYAAYEKTMKMPDINPLKISVNGGLEVFQISYDAGADSLVNSDFNDNLVYYTVYLGLYQYISPNSRLRYEFRAGMSFLSEGMQLASTNFTDNTFYSLTPGTSALSNPVSYNFRAMFYSSLLQNKNNAAGDWLSVYMSLTRYFAEDLPDLTGLGIGIRSDLSSRFSISAGFSMIIGGEFDSKPVQSTGQTVRLKVDGLQYEIMLLQFSF